MQGITNYMQCPIGIFKGELQKNVIWQLKRQTPWVRGAPKRLTLYLYTISIKNASGNYEVFVKQIWEVYAGCGNGLAAIPFHADGHFAAFPRLRSVLAWLSPPNMLASS